MWWWWNYTLNEWLAGLSASNFRNVFGNPIGRIKQQGVFFILGWVQFGVHVGFVSAFSRWSLFCLRLAHDLQCHLHFSLQTQDRIRSNNYEASTHTEAFKWWTNMGIWLAMIISLKLEGRRKESRMEVRHLKLLSKYSKIPAEMTGNHLIYPGQSQSKDGVRTKWVCYQGYWEQPTAEMLNSVSGFSDKQVRSEEHQTPTSPVDLNSTSPTGSFSSFLCSITQFWTSHYPK